MSGAAPDLIEAVLGFRAWKLEDDGTLQAWSAGTAWSPGVNEARCVGGHRHAAPDPRCTCGLYALHRPDDRRLVAHGRQVVGAVAAWGAMHVYRTGVRAERAMVVALARSPYADPVTATLLAEAAERHNVALVDRDDLFDVTRAHAAPVPADFLIEPRRRRGAGVTGAAGAGAGAGTGGAELPGPLAEAYARRVEVRGIAIDEHLWVRFDGTTARLGITAALAAHLGELDAAPPLPPVGRAVAPGDPLIVLGGRPGALQITAPVAGPVIDVNDALTTRPGLLLHDPEGAGWLAELRPAAKAPELASAVTWTGAEVLYAAVLAGQPRPFEDLQLSHLLALPPVRSFGEVATALRATRNRPRFAGAAQLHAHLARPLEHAVERSPAAARHARSIAWRLHDPNADLRLEGGRLETGDAAQQPADVELTLSADTAHALFTGQLDVPAALRAGRLQAHTDAAEALATLSVLKTLRIAPIPRRASWELAVPER